MKVRRFDRLGDDAERERRGTNWIRAAAIPERGYFKLHVGPVLRADRDRYPDFPTGPSGDPVLRVTR